MNLAIFITQTNQEEMRQLCSRLAAMQETIVNGALCVTHQDVVSLSMVTEITRELSERFKVKVALPVQSATTQSHDSQLALLFSRFLLGAYSAYPGAWLLMDQPATPRSTNFMQLAEKQHAAYGGKLTGKGILDQGSLLLVGPVSLDIPYQMIKFLRFATNESWRSRGRFFFSRCGFQSIPHDQYLFELAKPVHAESPQVVEPADVHEPTFFDAKAKEDAVEFMRLSHGFPAVAVVNADITPTVLAEPTKKELLDAAEVATGTRPHHFTSEAKLKAMIEQCTTTPA